MIDIKLSPSGHGLADAGTVNHIAYRTTDDFEHEQFRKFVSESEFHPTEILDRNNFYALYFLENSFTTNQC
ncbi:hypothetical protein CWR48_08255 [Oceanobacillus arenosus]|uniref:Glyoxalase/fosfomycin resistance/dioxygenase domain-containing protein n=1 Tax=Oceanobacillus arenosus TaxID=1229153 RepID=A0A3D8PTJ4_9BACI|nr:hypothetical protein CWR48_08255 [Oceanobacillus arenosus]